MGDQPDEKTKEFSKEELNVWSIEELRKYLNYRGIVITVDTRKRDEFQRIIRSYGQLKKKHRSTQLVYDEFSRQIAPSHVTCRFETPKDLKSLEVW